MRLKDRDTDFIIIGENIHTTRVLMRRGKLVTTTEAGVDAIRYRTADGEARLLPISEEALKTQDYEEGRVKHMKIATQVAMSGNAEKSREGMAYLRRQVQRQEEAGADFLDLNVDEISIKLDEQKEAIAWLVDAVQGMTDLPVSVDSSNSEVIESGLEATDRGGTRGNPMLNSASLERIEALDMVVEYNARVVVTASARVACRRLPKSVSRTRRESSTRRSKRVSPRATCSSTPSTFRFPSTAALASTPSSRSAKYGRNTDRTSILVAA